MIFTGILLRVTFFGIGLAGVVSPLASFRRDMIYDIAWSSVGSLAEASDLADLIASVCLLNLFVHVSSYIFASIW